MPENRLQLLPIQNRSTAQKPSRLNQHKTNRPHLGAPADVAGKKDRLHDRTTIAPSPEQIQVLLYG
ncbi:hypothetical protein [Snodgrassella communis]|uniref:Uncharacterized protein n=1 Tax=Snodgrassella alvi TaxID=1196083 RepID=A0A2N9XQ14_9NEIS|nr:hypothetical protein [Snodgrassella communis]PIT50419.1 hypothetical protein BHC48_06875 [Snodgrassella communis]